MGFFDRFRKRAPEPPPGVDLALVVYALAAADAEPGPRTPCVVLLGFDPVDVVAAFAPPGRADGAAEVAAAFARAVEAPPRPQQPRAH